MKPPRPRRLPTLEELERRRWHLWLVAAFLLISVSIAVVLVVVDQVAADELVANPALRWGFLALTLGFLTYVYRQERTFRRVLRELLSQREHAATLESRVRDLTTMADAARAVNSSLSAEEVFERLLSSALGLTRARTGSVLLKIRDELRVAVSSGPHAVARRTSLPLGTGDVGAVVVTGRPVVVDVAASGLPGVLEPQARASSAIIAPLVVSGNPVGALAIARGSGDPPFDDADLNTVELFAEHAATAVSNASRFERERSRVEQLVDAAEARSEFVARLVHDMRSPLVAMLGYSGILKDRFERMSAGQRSQAIDGLQLQGERLQRMIDETLRTTSTEAGAELDREPVDLSELLTECREVVTQATAALEGEAREVRFLGLGDPVVLNADGDALRHVFVNLLENAAKYSPPGAPIDVGVVRGDRTVSVHVSDRGAGIPADQVAHVFERFRRSQGSGSAGGVGLGLYIVRTLVRAHGGDVQVDSTPGKGTTFTVVLPSGGIRSAAEV